MLVATHNGSERVVVGILYGHSEIQGTKFLQLYMSSNLLTITQGTSKKPLIFTKTHDTQLSFHLTPLSLDCGAIKTKVIDIE